MSLMAIILLDGYRPASRGWPVYRLDTQAGQVETLWFANQRDGADAGLTCGVGDYRNCGKWLSEKKGFFAFYATNDSLHLWLNGQTINIAEHVTALRDTDFLLRKRFRVFIEEGLVFDCRYSYLDHEDVPDEDIFWNIARSLSSKAMRVRTFLLWKDKAEGTARSTDEYYAALTSRVNALLEGVPGNTGVGGCQVRV
jgi:hypothetical protein